MLPTRRHRRTLARTAVPVAALLLAACGGGGGGSSTPTTGASPTGSTAASATPKITDQSATAQLGGAYSAASALYNMGTNSSSLVTKDAEPGGRFSTLEFAMARLDALVKPPAGADGVATKAVASASIGCSGGGSASVVVNDANNDGSFGTGDAASFAFNACRENGITMSGRMLISQVLVTGSVYGPSYSVGATYTFDNLSAASAWAPTVTINGGFSLQAAYTTSPAPIVSATIAGSSFTAIEAGITDTLSNFSASLAVNAGTGRYQYSVSGREANSAQGVAFTLSSPTPFQGTAGTFPSSGSLRVQASDGSAARLTATSATSVVIDVDANGDGTYESSSVRTWSQVAGT